MSAGRNLETRCIIFHPEHVFSPGHQCTWSSVEGKSLLQTDETIILNSKCKCNWSPGWKSLHTSRKPSWVQGLETGCEGGRGSMWTWQRTANGGCEQCSHTGGCSFRLLQVNQEPQRCCKSHHQAFQAKGRMSQ